MPVLDFALKCETKTYTERVTKGAKDKYKGDGFQLVNAYIYM